MPEKLKPHSLAKAAAVATMALAFSAAAALSQGLSAELLAKAETNFKAANASGTGRLTPAEFRAFIDLNAASRIGRAATIAGHKAYERAFTALDADKDGTVSWDEYRKQAQAQK